MSGAVARVVAAALLGLLPGTLLAQPSVVDVYRDIQAAGVAPDLSYELSEFANDWVVTSPDWGTPIPVLVSNSDSYMRFSDEGTGGGSFDTEVAVWQLPDGTALVGVAETSYDPPWPMDTRLRFFGFDGRDWSDWTSYVWPGVGLADFLGDTMRIADLRALESIGASVQLVLPNGGTSAEARLITRDEEIEAVCNGADWFVPADPAPYLRYCDHITSRVARYLKLDWDISEMRFTKGAPIK